MWYFLLARAADGWQALLLYSHLQGEGAPVLWITKTCGVSHISILGLTFWDIFQIHIAPFSSIVLLGCNFCHISSDKK
jgi:hypothetical protein